MLTFILAIAAIGLVMTALTHAELRRPASTEPNASTERKAANVLTGLHAIVLMLVAAIVVLLLIGIAGWIADLFQ
jgi:hypothetical protein